MVFDRKVIRALDLERHATYIANQGYLLIDFMAELGIQLRVNNWNTWETGHFRRDSDNGEWRHEWRDPELPLFSPSQSLPGGFISTFPPEVLHIPWSIHQVSTITLLKNIPMAAACHGNHPIIFLLIVDEYARGRANYEGVKLYLSQSPKDVLRLLHGKSAGAQGKASVIRKLSLEKGDGAELRVIVDFLKEPSIDPKPLDTFPYISVSQLKDFMGLQK